MGDLWGKRGRGLFSQTGNGWVSSSKQMVPSGLSAQKRRRSAASMTFVFRRGVTHRKVAQVSSVRRFFPSCTRGGRRRGGSGRRPSERASSVAFCDSGVVSARRGTGSAAAIRPLFRNAEGLFYLRANGAFICKELNARFQRRRSGTQLDSLQGRDAL